MWSKELKDCDTPKSQVSHLRRMLTDLGMTGRFSMEQAKSIREKREFAKEMGMFGVDHRLRRPLLSKLQRTYAILLRSLLVIVLSAV